MVGRSKLFFIVVGLGAVLVVVLAVLSTSNQSITPVISYYHWKNTYRAQPDLSVSHPAHRLYIKFLDIGYRDQLDINPTRFIDAPRTAEAEAAEKTEVIPVVFLDNRALLASTEQEIREVLALILRYVPPQQYQNLQMDCDWTRQTRQQYFKLLIELQSHYSTLSATLRLHQVKYATRTGVPPVNYGALMYYNMSDVRDIKADNYVLDHALGRQYLQNFQQYPLPMVLALPLYQQVRVIRQQRLVLLLPVADFQRDKLEVISEGVFSVKQAHYWQGEYLYAGDELRVDQISIEQLQEASRELSGHIQPEELIFYSYQDARRYPHEALQSLSAIFGH